MENSISKEKVYFNAEGVKLCGNLYKPANFDDTKQYPSIITQGSAFSIKEQMSGGYARKMAENGFVALAFDYRTYGESEGQPRQYENPEIKRNDLEAAVTFLISLPYVNKVNALGVCASGGNVAHLAATDDRLNAIAIVAGMVGGPSELGEARGSNEEEMNALIQFIQQAKQDYEQTGEAKTATGYSSTDKNAFYYNEVDYYENEKRGNIKEFKNEYAIISLEPLFQFDPMSKAENINIPAIVFHSDNCVLPNASKNFYSKLKGEKELVWGTETQFNYYDKPELVNDVTTKATEFFKKYLN
ncbi:MULTISPECIES: alpha/beta hydrolase [unclassified Chryseobacterium]|nr:MULTISPECIES: alpha/beta hydrolase [unclassified Chryseobacterium]MCQ9635728.1 alpha/beta hydrolase [Chryseobacterium sp. WG23]CAH0168509.1 hypothetical protein SRABI04_01194 [Chryseobacterium sp. Bi04]